MNSFGETWQFICNYFKENMTGVAYSTWITRLEPVSLDLISGEAKIRVPNSFHKQTIESCYLHLFERAFEDIFNKKMTMIFITNDEIIIEKPKNEIKKSSNYEFTFDTFIVGSSNKFAHAACQSVSKNPGNTYNPLFIYGNSGLGKTHLLFSISNEIKKNNPDKNIVYIKGDDFVNELIDSISKKTNSAFRQKYRFADVLLIDDIHFIGGKEAVQEEFFHTFNALHQSNKQIVMTSDRPPKEIKTLEDRLRTRFEWGLIADISAPDFETRIAIIKRKAELLNLKLDDEIIEYIANKLKTNIRQLEGTVKKLQAYQSLGEKSNIPNVKNAISDILNNDMPPPVTIDKIITEVARTYGVTSEDIRSKKRSANVSNARQIAMFVVREVIQMSMVDIGVNFGGRDHSTVVYAMQKVEEIRETDPKTKEIIDDIIKNINAINR